MGLGAAQLSHCMVQFRVCVLVLVLVCVSVVVYALCATLNGTVRVPVSVGVD